MVDKDRERNVQQIILSAVKGAQLAMMSHAASQGCMLPRPGNVVWGSLGEKEKVLLTLQSRHGERRSAAYTLRRPVLAAVAAWNG